MGKINTLANLILHDRKAINKAIAANISKSRFSHLIPDKAYLKYMYKAHFGKKLDLKEPKTFNEKIQWLKLYDRKPEYCSFVDKYEVKKYIAETLGEEYIIPTLGIYDHFDEIDFDTLPEQFVLKCTHDSGSVVICRDKSSFDKEQAKEKLMKNFESNLYWHGREWPYKDLKPRIIAEKYMEEKGSDDLIDYKFYCFNGEPKFLYVSVGLSNHETARIGFVSFDWNIMEMKRTDFEGLVELPVKPVTFDKMVEFSKVLSKDIPFLRADFYEINGELYFGEMTFFPGAGFTKLEPDGWDEKLGEWIVLPKKTKIG